MNDKKQHIFCGAIAALVIGFITYLMSGEASSYSLAAGVYSALSGSFMASMVKEYGDTNYCLDPTRWDWKDIGATMIGGAIVALFIILMHFAKG